MSPEGAALVIVIGGLVTTTFGFAVAWLRVRERAIRAEMSLSHLRSEPARTDRLEQAVDAIAVEVERISEGQRFVTKLLAERTAPPE